MGWRRRSDPDDEELTPYAAYVDALPEHPPCPWLLPPQQLAESMASLGAHLSGDQLSMTYEPAILWLGATSAVCLTAQSLTCQFGDKSVVSQIITYVY